MLRQHRSLVIGKFERHGPVCVVTLYRYPVAEPVRIESDNLLKELVGATGIEPVTPPV